MAKFRTLAVPYGRHISPDGSITVTPQRVRRWVDNFQRMSTRGIKIPLAWGHAEEARPFNSESEFQQHFSKSVAGYVLKMEEDPRGLVIEGDAPGCEMDGDKLTHWFRAADGVERKGAINEVSAAIHRWRDGTGTDWPDSVLHVALTPLPVCAGQTGFQQLSALRRPGVKFGAGSSSPSSEPQCVPIFLSTLSCAVARVPSCGLSCGPLCLPAGAWLTRGEEDALFSAADGGDEGAMLSLIRLGWERRGQHAKGFHWYNTETKQHRYQKSEPGTGRGGARTVPAKVAPKKAPVKPAAKPTAKVTPKPASKPTAKTSPKASPDKATARKPAPQKRQDAQAFLYKVKAKIASREPVSAEELLALPGHLAALTKDELQQEKRSLGIALKSSQAKAEHVKALVDWATSGSKTGDAAKAPSGKSGGFDHGAVAEKINSLPVTAVADLRKMLPGVSDQQLAAGLEKLASARKVVLHRDANDENVMAKGGVKIGSQAISTLTARGKLTPEDVKQAFATTEKSAAKPKPAKEKAASKSERFDPALAPKLVDVFEYAATRASYGQGDFGGMGLAYLPELHARIQKATGATLSPDDFRGLMMHLWTERAIEQHILNEVRTLPDKDQQFVLDRNDRAIAFAAVKDPAKLKTELEKFARGELQLPRTKAIDLSGRKKK